MRRLLCGLTCLVAVGLGLCACDSGTQQPAVTKKKPLIAVIPKGTTHEFWKSIHAGAMKAAKELNVDIIWRGPLKEDDREEQIKVVEDSIARGVDGIVLAPLDDTALVDPVTTATKSGITVVIIDSDLKGGGYSSFVATDNYKAGQSAGAEMGRVLEGRGRIVMLRYQPGSASTTNRENGFLDAIKKFPKIQVVSENQYAGVTAESAFQKSENMLAPLRAADGALNIDGVFCPNESSTYGMLQALQSSKQAGKVKFIGFDSSPKLVDALKAGEIDALVVQNPMKMGYIGVRTVLEAQRGSAEKEVDTGATLVTKSNMEQPEVKELLNPPLEQYLK